LCQQRRRHLNQLDAAKIGGSDEAGHVANDASADRNDAGAAIGFELDQRLVGARGGRKLLVFLAIRQKDHLGLRHCPRQGPPVQLPYERARDEELPRCRLRRRLDEPPQLRRHAVFYVNGVGL